MCDVLKTIDADEYYLGTLEDVEMVAFAERSTEGGPTLMLSRAISPSDEDRELGEDGVYVEVCDQSRGRYGGLLSVEVAQNVVRVCFDADAAKLLKVREYLEIRIGALDVNRHLLVEKLREVVGKHIEVADLTSG